MNDTAPQGPCRCPAVAFLVTVGLLVVLGTLAGCAPGDPVGGDAAADTVAPNATAATATTTALPLADPPGPPPTLAPDDPAGARLRVTQDLTGCCYATGHLSWLLVIDADGDVVVQRQVRPPADPLPVVDLSLPAGRYHAVSAQQPCARTCADVGDVVDRCDTDVDLAAGSTTYLTVGVAPASGCVFVLSATPLASPVADEVVLPGAEIDCGHDASLAEASVTGRNVALSDARRCLAAAARRGASAWLQADEPGDGGSGTAMVAYRLAPDGSVSVYQVVDPAAPSWGWVRSVCDAVVADDVRGFLVQGCRQPEAVPWVASI